MEKHFYSNMQKHNCCALYGLKGKIVLQLNCLFYFISIYSSANILQMFWKFQFNSSELIYKLAESEIGVCLFA